MKKGKKWKKIEAFCILLIVTLLLIFVRILYQPGTESERGELYTFSNGWYQLEVCIGDRLLYQYKDNRFEKNRQMKGKIWADISLPEKIGQEVLSISYETKKNARLYVYAPMIGEFCFLFRQHLLESIFSILMILGMTGLGDCLFIYQTQTNCRKEIFKCSTVFDSMQSVVHF